MSFLTLEIFDLQVFFSFQLWGILLGETWYRHIKDKNFGNKRRIKKISVKIRDKGKIFGKWEILERKENLEKENLSKKSLG